MRLGSQAVKDVVSTSAAFVMSCDERPLDLTETQAERFTAMCNALVFLQALVQPSTEDGGEHAEGKAV